MRLGRWSVARLSIRSLQVDKFIYDRSPLRNPLCYYHGYYLLFGLFVPLSFAIYFFRGVSSLGSGTSTDWLNSTIRPPISSLSVPPPANASINGDELRNKSSLFYNATGSGFLPPMSRLPNATLAHNATLLDLSYSKSLNGASWCMN